MPIKENPFELLDSPLFSLHSIRHDYPDDMQEMVLNAGHWQLYNEKSQSPEVLVEVRTLMGRLRFELCLN